MWTGPKMYENTQGRVLLPVGKTDWFEITALILSHIDKAERLLLGEENAAANVGLHLNAAKMQLKLRQSSAIQQELKPKAMAQ